jgi:Flp pilus assembly protein TadG
MLMTRLFSRFRRNRDGLAAVEFALILPLMITLFFGVVEVSLALACRADVTNVASTVTDLVAQESAVTPQDMTNVFNAATMILYPNTINSATITVYSIIDNGGASGKVAWSCVKTGAANATTGPTTVPAGTNGGQIIADANLDPKTGQPTYGGTGSVILTNITYNYSSPTSKIITGPVTMQNNFMTKPRTSAQVTKPSSCS